MPASPDRAAIEAAWLRAAGACECARAHHPHGVQRCGRPVEWTNRGRHGDGAWELRRVDADTVEILCWDCHAKDI